MFNQPNFCPVGFMVDGNSPICMYIFLLNNLACYSLTTWQFQCYYRGKFNSYNMANLSFFSCTTTLLLHVPWHFDFALAMEICFWSFCLCYFHIHDNFITQKMAFSLKLTLQNETCIFHGNIWSIFYYFTFLANFM